MRGGYLPWLGGGPEGNFPGVWRIYSSRFQESQVKGPQFASGAIPPPGTGTGAARESDIMANATTMLKKRMVDSIE